MNPTSELAEPVVSTAKVLAPDDLQVGDYIGVMSYVSEYVSFFWCNDANLLPPDLPVRVRWTPSDVDGPLQVRAVCLPFVLVETPSDKCRQLDTRVHQLARVDPDYAKLAISLLKRDSDNKAKKGKRKKAK